MFNQGRFHEAFFCLVRKLMRSISGEATLDECDLLTLITEIKRILNIPITSLPSSPDDLSAIRLLRSCLAQLQTLCLQMYLLKLMGTKDLGEKNNTWLICFGTNGLCYTYRYFKHTESGLALHLMSNLVTCPSHGRFYQNRLKAKSTNLRSYAKSQWPC